MTGGRLAGLPAHAVAVADAPGTARLVRARLPLWLTAEFLTRVEARFGAKPAEWHSGVTMTERRRLWRMVSEGGAELVVGARSALFLPFQDLGLIVVDEEHDTSYKQEDGVLYNARDMAVLRAAIAGRPVVVALAPPSPAPPAAPLAASALARETEARAKAAPARSGWPGAYLVSSLPSTGRPCAKASATSSGDAITITGRSIPRLRAA